MFTASGGLDERKPSAMPSVLSRRKIETRFVLWSDSSDAAWCESGPTILIITQFLPPSRNKERIVHWRSANLPIQVTAAHKSQWEMRAGIGGAMADVSGDDNNAGSTDGTANRTGDSTCLRRTRCQRHHLGSSRVRSNAGPPCPKTGTQIAVLPFDL
jgi:hypothetical protein